MFDEVVVPVEAFRKYKAKHVFWDTTDWARIHWGSETTDSSQRFCHKVDTAV